MRFIIPKEFEEDYEQVDKNIDDQKAFRRAFHHATNCMISGKDLSKLFTVNKIAALGEGWYTCYIYEDIVILYQFQGESVRLARIGTPKQLLKKK